METYLEMNMVEISIPKDVKVTDIYLYIENILEFKKTKI